MSFPLSLSHLICLFASVVQFLVFLFGCWLVRCGALICPKQLLLCLTSFRLLIPSFFFKTFLLLAISCFLFYCFHRLPEFLCFEGSRWWQWESLSPRMMLLRFFLGLRCIENSGLSDHELESGKPNVIICTFCFFFFCFCFSSYCLVWSGINNMLWSAVRQRRQRRMEVGGAEWLAGWWMHIGDTECMRGQEVGGFPYLLFSRFAL